MSLLTLGVWFGMIVLTIVLGVIHIKKLKHHWRKSLLLGLICVGLFVPLLVFQLAHLDVESAMQHLGGDGGMQHTRLIFYIGLGIGLCIHLLRIPWYGFVYHTAVCEWNVVNADAFPILDKNRREEGSSLITALVFGAVAGGLSVWVFWALQVELSDPMKSVMHSFPGAFEAPVGIRVALTIPAMLMPAIAEELAFRGVLMGFVERVLGRSRGAILVAIVVAAGLWGIVHLANTTHPGIKFIQIFVIGLALGWFARNGKIEKAIAAHASLNVVVAASGLFLGV